jgi:hypothetical protein
MPPLPAVSELILNKRTPKAKSLDASPKKPATGAARRRAAMPERPQFATVLIASAGWPTEESVWTPSKRSTTR